MSTPNWLYHSTSYKNLKTIKRQGLKAAEWEDEEIVEAIGQENHNEYGIAYLLFFTHKAQDEYGEVQLRFDGNKVAKHVNIGYSSDRHNFLHSTKPFAISPDKLEILKGKQWVPLMSQVKATIEIGAAPRPKNSTTSPDLQDKIKAAATLGREAFLAGKKAIPAQDAKLMKLLEGLPLGGGGTIIMKAWSDAWHRQNLTSASIETTAAPPRIDDIEHTIRVIFKKAGLPLERKDSVTARRRSTGGYVITINSSHKAISFKSLMRLRAYLLHRFKSKHLTTAPMLVNGKPQLRYSIIVKQIKRDKEGAHKLERKGEKKAAPKNPAAAKGKTRTTAALARIRTYMNTQAA